MLRSEPKKRLGQIIIISKLLEKPMRYNRLKEAVYPWIKQKSVFNRYLLDLVDKRIVRQEATPQHSTYSIADGAEKFNKKDFSTARHLSASGSAELITDCMEYLANSGIFSSSEEAVEAALDFWVERYRNLVTLNALFSLIEEDHAGEGEAVSAFGYRQLYRPLEDKYFEIVARFKHKHKKAARVLKRKLFSKGVELTPSWMNCKLNEFLSKYYPEAYEKLEDHEKAKIFFRLQEMEKEKEYIYCKRDKTEYPVWTCSQKVCKSFSQPSNIITPPNNKKVTCQYRKIAHA